MAQLRAIGSFIDGTGFSDMWSESNIYENRTTKGILDGGTVRRAIEAHIFILLKSSSVKLNTLQEALQTNNINCISNAHRELISGLERLGLTAEMEKFDSEMDSGKPNIKVTRQYMKMVETVEVLEHENRRMKVAGGLTGITQNPKALNCFSLSSPELARIGAEGREMLNVASSKGETHPALNKSTTIRHRRNVEKLIAFLKETRSPFLYEGNHLAHSDFDLKSVISKYELTAIPRSLYSSDGQMYHCLAKSKVMHLIEGLIDITKQEAIVASQNSAKGPFKVAIIDAMAEVQMLDKPDHTVTSKELFFKLRMKYNSFEEVHLVFDTYLQHFFKNWIRKKRQGVTKTEKARAGVACLIHNDWVDGVQDWTLRKERILEVNLNIGSKLLTIVIAYGSNKNERAETKDKF
ncbi:hypothetical protein ILUMI_22349 [Ignelater luminosus]|uniref:Uncharacterized protein n=1 Tax=Ignelater luminosus TaxID=2038154 RepID=A0A8K0CFZ4_IGNLU|nr:hypothetical protein ILUMI_22349 [Ignelater luminosus]